MKIEIVAAMIGMTLATAAWATDEVPATAPVTPDVAPAAPVVAPVAAPVVNAEREETKDLQGSIEVRDKGAGDVIRVFIDKESGKRMVMPSNVRQLPNGFVWGQYNGEVALKAVLLFREKDGKPQIIIKRILALTDIQPAPAATEPAPVAEPVASEEKAPAAAETPAP